LWGAVAGENVEERTRKITRNENDFSAMDGEDEGGDAEEGRIGRGLGDGGVLTRESELAGVVKITPVSEPGWPLRLV
jgi:hypothetical protein